MRFARAALVMLCLACLCGSSARAGTEPSLAVKRGEPRLRMPMGMRSAILRAHPDFQIWRFTSFSATIRGSYMEIDDRGRSELISPLSAPFCLIVDVNGDGQQDLIVDGHNEVQRLILAVVSAEDGYRVLVVETYPFKEPSQIESFNDGRREVGINSYLWGGSGEASIFQLGFPQQTSADGELLNDGGFVDYHLRKGVIEAVAHTL